MAWDSWLHVGALAGIAKNSIAKNRDQAMCIGRLVRRVASPYCAPVPTVLREKGYRFGFYSSEPDEPAHVHVCKAGCEAKFWLAPVQLSWSKGYRESDLREIARILENHQIELIEAWNETE